MGEKASVSVRENVMQPYYSIKAKAPVANVILFAGGGGNLNRLQNNFLVRSRNLFVKEGFNVILVDVPSDKNNMYQFRASENHARDIGGIIAVLRRESDFPVWLIGTSMGTVSTVNVAARLKEGGPDGIVLTSSQFRPWKKDVTITIGTPGLEKVRVPTLFVHHRFDGCRLTKFEDLEGFMQQFTNTLKVEKIVFEGGSPPRSRPCRALSKHGFLGIEEEVVKAIGDWIKTNISK